MNLDYSLLAAGNNNYDDIIDNDSLAALTDKALLGLAIREKTMGGEKGAALLEKFGNVAAIASSSAKEISTAAGIRSSGARSLLAGMALGQRAVTCGLPLAITCPKDAFRLFSPLFIGYRQEAFKAACLDSKKRPTLVYDVSLGSIDASFAHPREVFRKAVLRGAHSIFIAHNHPSGHPAPSEEDKATTSRLIESGNLLGIKLVDHIIIGRGCYYSFIEDRTSFF
ncbi:MAG: hypothetical protein FWG10_02155 [Eubacteriaceae bacterium]|nr:hypothetical protein [Eubacteriaceae bacterium]